LHLSGVACILGTGSNSCLYDGNEITDNVDSLGFTLGDEGSGGELGRRLVKSYFYRDMPSDLVLHFREKYQMSKADFFEHVYRKPLPNRFLASFSTFCSEHIEHPFIQELIRGNFDAFITTQVLKYEGIKEMPVHFIGSIAQVFQEQLEEVLAIRGLKLGKVIRNPINNLLAYHLS
jgi:glucosamine kinase